MQRIENKPRPFLAGFGIYKGLEKSIYALFAIRIINRFGDFVQLLLVLILTGRLGMDSKQAGLFVSASLFVAMLGQFGSGYSADRWGRKPVLVFCQLMMSLSYLICALLIKFHPSLVPYVILFASPFRGGTSPITNTMVADISKEADRARSFSLLYLGTNIGVALGPMVASALYVHSMFLLFLVSSVLVLLSTALLVAKVPDLHPLRSASDANQDRPDTKPLVVPPVMLVFFLSTLVYSLTYGQNTFALPLQFTSYFGDEQGSKLFATLMMVNAVTVLLATTFLTAWTAKRGQLVSMAVAMAFYVVGYAAYAFCNASLVFLVATVIWTQGEILMATNTNVFLNAYAPPSSRAKFNALLHIFSSIGHSLSPILGGLLLIGGSYRLLWLLNSGACLLLLCLYVALKKYLRK